MTYVISWPNDSFLVEFSGKVTAAEIEAVNHAFSGDERIESIRYALWDFSHASAIDMPDAEIEYAAAFDKGVTYVRPHLRGALVVSNDQVRAQLEKYLAFADDLDVDWDTRIFDTIGSARDWLEKGDPQAFSG